VIMTLEADLKTTNMSVTTTTNLEGESQDGDVFVSDGVEERLYDQIDEATTLPVVNLDNLEKINSVYAMPRPGRPC
jgi:hypothetical protein